MRPLTVRSAARATAILATAILLGSALGCGERTYPVTGVVKFRDGQPARELADGAVVFITPDLKQSSRGDIRADGTFKLETLDLRDGALARKYLVVVMPPPQPEGGTRRRRTVPPRYQKPETSGIEVEVRAGEPNHFEIVVDEAPVPKR